MGTRGNLTRSPARGAESPSRARALTAAICTVTLVIGFTSAALAQNVPTIPSDPISAVPDPYATGEQTASENELDTDHTPIPKEGTSYWTQVAGARYPTSASDEGTELVGDSATPFDLDLYDVSLRDSTLGFAGGARCADPPVREEGEPAAGFGARVEGCERVPAIYRFIDTAQHGKVWAPVDLPGDGSPGYVGAIAWMPDGRALAVGGTGAYPRREPGRTDEQGATLSYEEWVERDEQQGAGMARAWLFNGIIWREITPDLPGDMRALTAVDFYPGTGKEFGYAGGLGQLWEWEGGTFTEKLDRDTDAGKPAAQQRMRRATLFEYRVRDLEFVPGSEAVYAFAVTSGCCAESPLYNRPRILYYNGPAEQWWVREMARDPLAHFGGSTGTDSDSTNGRGVGGVVNDATEPTGLGRPIGLNEHRVNQKPNVPDSLYAVMPQLRAPPGQRQTSEGQSSEGFFTLSLLATPGGPSLKGEQPSMSLGSCATNSDGTPAESMVFPTQGPISFQAYAATDALRTNLSTTRLHDAGGDAAPTPRLSSTNAQGGGGRPSTQHRCGATADWSVGELRSTRLEGLGARGLAYATHLSPQPIGETINADVSTAPPSLNRPAPNDLTQGYEPTSEAKLRAYVSSQYFLLPSYSVNSLDVDRTSGTTWAVGDHGAILSLSERAQGGSSASEPEPPRLPPAAPKGLPERSPYEGQRPPGDGEVGSVPSLSVRPRGVRGPPRLYPAGSPDPSRVQGVNNGEAVEDIGQIVMSRDGSEGWAIGPNPVTRSGYGDENVRFITSLYRYDGRQWSRCDPIGVSGQLPPDPACAGLARLRDFVLRTGTTQVRTNVKLNAAARVPLENDADPSNDDEFEVVAIGTAYQEGSDDPADLPAILRYRDGRWRLEDRAARDAVRGAARAVGFTAPDDGWILALTGGSEQRLYRFDGQRWIDCKVEGQACGEPASFLTAAIAGGEGVAVNDLVAAGDRIYLFGTRQTQEGHFPLIAYRQPGGHWTTSGGGYDPGCTSRSPAGACTSGGQDAQGSVNSLTVARRADGAYEGWAVGVFGGRPLAPTAAGFRPVSRTPLLRLVPSGGWQPFADPGAAGELLANQDLSSKAALDQVRGESPAYITRPQLQAILPAGEDGEPSQAFIAQRRTGTLFGFDPGRERWELIDGGERPPRGGGLDGNMQAIAPDGQGGLWVAVRNGGEVAPGSVHHFLFRYTDRPAQPVFEEAPHPLAGDGGHLTALSGDGAGGVWAATSSGSLARYDRLTGWERVNVPGWDPGRVVTRPSAVTALAVNAAGVGVAAGEGGRIAELTPEAVSLDRAAGRGCNPTDIQPPCGTGRDLHAAAVAPDGSAMVGGERLALLWRPPGDEFRAITQPDAELASSVTGISMPAPGRAWLTTDRGTVFAGQLRGETWSWTLESAGQAVDAFGLSLGLRDIAVDGGGHGYAVGDRGAILERTGRDERPWRRLDTPYLDNLTAVALPLGGGEGGLIGGRNGLVLTRSGDGFEVARHADYFTDARELTGPVVGIALLPGVAPGQAEAWAALGQPATDTTGTGDLAQLGTGPNQILHYASDPAEPLLDPGSRTASVPDAPAPRADEISFAAFGKSDCHLPLSRFCGPMTGSTSDFEVISRRIGEELLTHSGTPGDPAFAVFTGDTVDSAGLAGGDLANQAASPTAQTNGPAKLRRWRELVAGDFDRAGLPLLGAIGNQDLSETCVPEPEGACFTSTKEHAKAGDNLSWRQAMAARPAPWGSGGAPSPSGGLSFEPTPGSADGAREFEDQEVDADGEGPLPTARAPLGGASTHYAVEALRDGAKVARLVFVDNTLRSLAASDPIQQPFEPDGGQLAWLERMICVTGDQTDNGAPCTREPGQQAIVVANTPTYSYGPGVITDTASDGAAFEAKLMEHDVKVVVSGRLGWNGRYWATAPGLHEPCPGQAYAEDAAAPQPGTRTCDLGTPGELQDPVGTAQSTIDEATGGQAGQLSGLLPFVVASGAGGKFGPDGRAAPDASQGFWHGYTVVRLDASGDPYKTVVEQRPIYDWIGIEAPAHVLRAGKKLTLHGFGRGPIAVPSTGPVRPHAQVDSIASAAVTHRYDLLVADPDEPWLPREGIADDDCDPYDCLDPKVAAVDDQSGEVKAGNGQYPRTFAVAQLSVGEQSATYPLVLEPRASFRAPAPPPPVPVAVPAPPPPPAAAPPTTPQVNLPSAPVLPVLTAQALAPPPVPPSPPTFASEAPLDLNLSPAALDVTPPTAVSQPPTPPVNPAPPSGARREARQRQAAAQKSGADSDQEGSSEEALDGGDLAESPMSPKGAPMTRHDFTAIASREQPSAWARDALLGGGLGIAALILALGLGTARPTPRRRPPEVPAPAEARAWRRRS